MEGSRDTEKRARPWSWRPWVRRLWFFSIVAAAGGCDGCNSCSMTCQEGEARCSSNEEMMVCTDGDWAPIACAGPKGCEAEGRFIACDETVAEAGAPCGRDGEGAAACNHDGDREMICKSGVWTERYHCRGPDGCRLTKDLRFVDCDNTLAEVGDPCHEGDYTCQSDGTAILHCEGGKLVVNEPCGDAQCQIAGGGIACGATE